MVELEYHPGIIEPPRRHEWQQGVVLDQPHRVLEYEVSHQRRDVVVRLPMKLSVVEPYIPRDGVPDE